MITYSDFSDEQRQLYLKALISVARADQELDEDEIAFYLQIAEGMGVDPAVAESVIEGSPLEIASIPPLHTAVGALILRDLAAMAVVNNALREEEEALILEIGQAMQFTGEEVNEFLDWAFMGLQWQLRSTSLLEKFDQPSC
jgi:hypothetical protein